jgi:Ca-activated chloride channel family protein
LAAEVHDERFRGFQDILMMSDGDDPARDEEWRLGAEAARRQGIPVHTVGIGNPDADSPIPVGPDQYLRHQRQPVRTRLHERPLREIARLTDGTYTPARTQALPLGELFRDRLEARAERDQTEDALPAYRLRYAWFFGPAALLFAAEMLPGRRRKTTSP